jgi:hypothetical protein
MLRIPHNACGLQTGQGLQEVAIADGHELQVWDLRSQIRLADLHPGCESAHRLAFMGERLAAADDRQVHVWDWKAGDLLARSPVTDRVLAIFADQNQGAICILEAGDADKAPAVRMLSIAGA